MSGGSDIGFPGCLPPLFLLLKPVWVLLGSGLGISFEDILSFCEEDSGLFGEDNIFIGKFRPDLEYLFKNCLIFMKRIFTILFYFISDKI
ncbi:hypothetical protein NSB1T_13480 [Coprobacter fastidiosus NSB1 = JCM 33896]|nr:hypothetical protein NSB1T_13480 [Coprobacter fastidiosus NSB1 = JCM 33896]